MFDLLSSFYPWIKAFHIMAVMSWIAGLFYLPRLYVYHAEQVGQSGDTHALFQTMEFKLLRVIMNPAMIIAWVLGLWLAWSGGHYSEIWFLLKFSAVIAMSAVHGIFSKAVRLFAEDRNEKPARYWRMINEVPTLLMIAIVVLVIVKPF